MTDDISAVLIDPSPENWSLFGEQIYRIEQANFGSQSLDKEMMKADMNDPNTSWVVLMHGGSIIGFTYAVPESERTARIVDTVISKEYQHRGYVALLMACLEDDLRKKGYGFVTRDSMIENGYADKIAEHYADRVVEMGDIESQWGRQRHFKIKI
jgi:hypothetical protein